MNKVMTRCITDIIAMNIAVVMLGFWLFCVEDIEEVSVVGRTGVATGK